MKALTICQPYAHMIALPDDNDDAKRIENRTWATWHRGPLAIHAGKSREWLDTDRHFDDMIFGAVVAVAIVRDCFEVQSISKPRETMPSRIVRDYPWLLLHRHVEGPFCWLLAEVRRLAQPITCAGQQGLWTVPDNVEEAIKLQLGGPN